MRRLPSVRELAGGIVSGLLDLVYPPKCLICGELGPHYLCPRCSEDIRTLGPFVCRRCGAPVEDQSCRECRGRDLYFDGAHSVAVYEGVLREAIHRLKYSNHSCLIPELGEMMVGFCRDYPMNWVTSHIDGVVAVPIDRTRLSERGFSQSEMLAGYVAASINKPLLQNALIRTRRVPPQSSLSYEQRLVNLQGVFAVSDSSDVSGKSLLLIDDVFTTGSTANEAAKTLKDAGAAEVHVFTLARSL